MSDQTNSRQDIYTRITASIVAQLKTGTRPWTRPWSAGHPADPITRPLRFGGQPYSGINVLSLWASAMAQKFAAPVWMTYRQAQELGGQVRNGEKGSAVVYANAMTRTATDPESGDEVETSIRFLKGYTVFNVEQIDGLPSHFYAPPPARTEPLLRIKRAEAFFTASGAAIEHGGSRAFYGPSTDTIRMPPFGAKYVATPLTRLAMVSESICTLRESFGARHWFSLARAAIGAVRSVMAVPAVPATL